EHDVHVGEAPESRKGVEVTLDQPGVAPEPETIERLGERVPTDLAIQAIGLPVAPDVGGLPALPEFQGIEVRRADRRQDVCKGSARAGPHVDQRAVHVERDDLHQRGRRGASAHTRSTSSIIFGTPTVNTSWPSAVIRTSSSILTPMPRNSRGI